MEGAANRDGEASKAIFVPSGDHARRATLTVPLVSSLVIPDPSAFITWIPLPFTKAILLPSGDHAGFQAPPSRLVSLLMFDPSLLTT